MYKFVFLLVVCCIFFSIILQCNIKFIQKKVNKFDVFLIEKLFVFLSRAPPYSSYFLMDKEDKMKKIPKRRKSKDNPYTIDFNKNLNTYTVSFIDTHGKQQEVIIDDELYFALNAFELLDVSFMNEYDRHIEHLEQTEASLYYRSFYKGTSLENQVIKKIELENLHKNINTLPDIQKRRLKKYFFEEKTLKEIALEENCSIRSIKYSIDIALEKLKKSLKNENLDFKK